MWWTEKLQNIFFKSNSYELYGTMEILSISSLHDPKYFEIVSEEMSKKSLKGC